MFSNEKLVSHMRRLVSDYRSMQQIKGTAITWQALEPYNIPQSYPAKYQVVFNIVAPTVAGTRRQHTVEIDCSTIDYPHYPPSVKFHTPVVKHPHVFSDGSQRVCLGGFPLAESLADLCIRLGRFMQYDPLLINPHSIASHEFYTWYLQNRQHLPLDHTSLPLLDGPSSGIKIIRQRSSRT